MYPRRTLIYRLRQLRRRGPQRRRPALPRAVDCRNRRNLAGLDASSGSVCFRVGFLLLFARTDSPSWRPPSTGPRRPGRRDADEIIVTTTPATRRRVQRGAAATATAVRRGRRTAPRLPPPHRLEPASAGPGHGRPHRPHRAPAGHRGPKRTRIGGPAPRAFDQIRSSYTRASGMRRTLSTSTSLDITLTPI